MKTRSSRNQAKSTTEDALIEKIRARARARGGEASASETESRPDSNPRTSVSFSASALLFNARTILDQVPGQAMLPMIKANAYGHGATWAGRVLIQDPRIRARLYGLGVATPEEARALRETLGAEVSAVQILALSGCSPWTDELGQFCERYHVTPVLVSDEDFRAFVRGEWQTRLKYELKFNTGMNRLGLTASQIQGVSAQLKKMAPEHRPQGVLTHLASGEDADLPLSRKQREVFQSIRGQLESICPSAHFHIANSAAIWAGKHWRLQGFTDVVRPGLSLYGVPPWEGAPARGLLPVANWSARVARIASLNSGDAIGYGGTYRVRDKQLRTATLGVGYADGFMRALSSSEKTAGTVIGPKGDLLRVLGRVSMDLTVIQAPDTLKVGHRVTLLGDGVDIWKQARAAGTVPYELLTSIGGRVQRIYV